ncbi:toll/interleukin-1 receptor domain-containing protein, partial [bacterium]|nr:toll/interleukin-1 receptor domain-containing protein [bacterium]MBU1024480.1 toll/interleukin-1 receptor domain-containing protein [bacterium]
MNKTNQKYDIFITYSHHDFDIVEEIANYLSDAGIVVWFDKWHSIPGSSSSEIGEALSESSTIGVCIGADSSPVEQIDLEKLSRDRQQDIIPILLPKANRDKIPESLKDMFPIDFSDQFPSSREFGKLIAYILGSKKTTEIEKEQYIGDALKQLGNNEEALVHFQRALHFAEQIKGNGQSQISASHNYIGSVLRDLGKWDDALEHFQKSLSIDEKTLGT